MNNVNDPSINQPVGNGHWCFKAYQDISRWKSACQTHLLEPSYCMSCVEETTPILDKNYMIHFIHIKANLSKKNSDNPQLFDYLLLFQKVILERTLATSHLHEVLGASAVSHQHLPSSSDQWTSTVVLEKDAFNGRPVTRYHGSHGDLMGLSEI